MLLSIHDFQQNWCREGHTLLTSVYGKKIYMHTNILLSVSCCHATSIPHTWPMRGNISLLMLWL
jgi:hypothetical protein